MFEKGYKRFTSLNSILFADCEFFSLKALRDAKKQKQ